HSADRIDPGSGGVEDLASPDPEFRADDAVYSPHAGEHAASGLEGYRFDVISDRRSVQCGGPDHAEAKAGIVHLGVVILRAARQFSRTQVGEVIRQVKGRNGPGAPDVVPPP